MGITNFSRVTNEALSALGLLLLGTTVAGRFIPLALIWLAHISFDRLLGFGLHYSTGVGETHLGRIGRGGPSCQPA